MAHVDALRLGRYGWREPAALIGGALAVAGVALLVPQHSDIALGLAAAALVTALAVRGSALLIVAAVPAVWLGEITRLGGGVMSIADAFLIAGAAGALLRTDLGNRALRLALVFVTGFEAVQLLALVHQPSAFAAQEWLHRLLLIGGALIIGAAVVRTGRLRAALLLFLAGGAVIAVLSVVFAVATHLAPAYPLLNKNYAGDLLAAAILVALLCPRDVVRLGHLRTPLVVTLGLGLLATQSRGAMLGLGCALVLYAVIRRRFDGWSILLVLGMLAGLTAFASLVGGETALEQQQHYGGLFDRQLDLQQALQAWMTSPLIGTGIRLWQSGLYSLQGDPHNVVALTLAESGVVGLVAFIGMLGATAWLLFRRRTELAMLALALLAARFVHGLFDVYWVHGSLALPWMVVGAALTAGAGTQRSE